MKTLITNYSFNAVDKTITINELSSISCEQLLLITNVTKGIIIYNFADFDLGASSVLNNIITLKYDTTTMNNSDKLQIFIDNTLEILDGENYSLKNQYTFDTNLNQVFGSQPITDSGNLKTKTIYADYYNNGKISALNEQIGINCIGCPSVAIQISGTWVGTVTFEGTTNGADFIAINGMAINGSTIVSSTTSVGIYRFNTSGIIRLKARFSAYTSGYAIITLASTGEQGVVSLSNAVNGSQSQPLTQRATSYELSTYDTNLSNVLGTSTLWRQGFAGTDFAQAPNINPTQPSTYVSNTFVKYPQILPRLRVEIGGDKKLPFAQEDITNKLIVSNDDERRLLEEIVYQLTLLNQNYAIINNSNLKLDFNDRNK